MVFSACKVYICISTYINYGYFSLNHDHLLFYQQSGVLFFGSRLRRLSESFLADVNRVYQQHGITFDAAWFPVFYMLSKKETLSIREISAELETSHSAASQLISKLQEKGLIRTASDKSDARKKLVAFSPKGQKLLKQVQPVWDAMQHAMDELLAESPDTRQLMTSILETEKSFQRKSLYERIETHLESENSIEHIK